MLCIPVFVFWQFIFALFYVVTIQRCGNRALMNHLLGGSSHLRLCAPAKSTPTHPCWGWSLYKRSRQCVPRLYAPAKSNLAYPYAGALSNPCFPCKARRLNAQKITHQHPVKRGFLVRLNSYFMSFLSAAGDQRWSDPVAFWPPCFKAQSVAVAMGKALVYWLLI